MLNELSAGLQVVIALPLFVLTTLSLNLVLLTWLRLSRRSRPSAVPELAGDLPVVLVQLPLFNEGDLIDRLLDTVAALDWPKDRMMIQVLDDSTDGSLLRSQSAAARLCAAGFQVEVLHRTRRDSFKAGALANGLAASSAPYVAIFDADFLPPPDFLKRTVPLLAADQRLAFVQARWAHLNPHQNRLTAVQAALLDAHFAVEQEARCRAGLPLPFNGTCGVWRRAAIDDAGGWQGDTLTEDLDLSLRAQLRGWRARFLADLAVPGELPTTAEAWRTQQFRWTKGYAQVAAKLLGTIWRGPWTVWQKLVVTLQLGQSAVFPTALTCLLLSLPLIALEYPSNPWLAMLGVATAVLGLTGTSVFLATGQRLLGLRQWGRLTWAIPLALVFTSGLLLSNSRAVVEAWLGRHSPFVRTPKGSLKTRLKPPPRWRGWPEVSTALALSTFLVAEAAWQSPFFTISILGLITIGVLRGRQEPDKPAPMR